MDSYGGVVNEKDLIPKLEELNASMETVIGQAHNNVSTLNKKLDNLTSMVSRIESTTKSIRRLVMGIIILTGVAIASATLLVLAL